MDPLRFVRNRARRRAWVGTHPLLGAILGTVWATLVLFLAIWPVRHLLRGIVVTAIAGGLLGVGLFFAFRSDPKFREQDAPKSD
jgi:hypothetical protein